MFSPGSVAVHVVWIWFLNFCHYFHFNFVIFLTSDFMKVCRLWVPFESNFTCTIRENACAFDEIPMNSSTILPCYEQNQIFFFFFFFVLLVASRKHAYIILTPFNPLLCSKTGVYRGIHYFSYFCSKHRLWVLVRTASSRRF